jgi:methionyl-tRNA formyltransferase
VIPHQYTDASVVVAGGTPYLLPVLNSVMKRIGAVDLVVIDRQTCDRYFAGLATHVEDWCTSHGSTFATSFDGLDHAVRVLFSFIYTKKVPDSVLDCAGCALNFHPAPLPDLRGMRVIEYALLTQRPSYSVTCHHMTGDFDAGDVIAELDVPISRDDTYGSLFAKAMQANVRLVRQVLDTVARGGVDTMERRPQVTEGVFASNASVQRLVESLEGRSDYAELLARALPPDPTP